MSSRARTWPALIAAFGFTGCGDDTKNNPDAKPPEEAGPEVVDFSWDEGGESRIEYQQILNGAGATIIQARATAFFWKSKTPKRYQFPDIPGCTKIDFDDRFPMGMGTQHEYLDVGTVTYSGGANVLELPVGSTTPPTMNLDGLFRPHDGLYHFKFFPGDGLKYFGNFNAFYDLKLGGSAEWPAQEIKNAHYMPNSWQLKPPGPGFEKVVLTRGQDLKVTYEIPDHSNRPPGSSLNMVVGIVIPPFGPAVDCIDDNLDGEIIIPATYVDYAIDSNRRQNKLDPTAPVSGVLARAHISHLVRELTDGTTHNHKRVDFISIWCYVVPWSAAAEP